MRVFISWSGDRSHRVALILRDWLPSVLRVDPWVSSEDIDKGARWIIELGSQLASAQFGILCLVPGNLPEPWLNFEAGVMSRAIDAARVAPLLVGVDRSNLEGPLAQFQSTVFEKEDVRRLVHSINRAAENAVAPDRLDRTFELAWPGFAQAIEALAIRGTSPDAATDRNENGELDATEIQVLNVLASRPDAYPSDHEIASAIGGNITRTQYHLDRLGDRGLVDAVMSIGAPPGYYLTAAGRAYLVERDLV